MSLRIVAVVCRTVALLLAALISACSYEATPPVQATGAADVVADKAQTTKSVDSASLIAVSGSNVNPETTKSAKAVAETTVQTSETPATQRAAALSNELSAELSAGQLVVEAGEAMSLRFTVANNTEQTHRILTWASPLEAEISGVMFRVMATGDAGTEEEEIPYSGLMIRRGPPPDEAFIDLAPGEKVTNDFALDSSYDVSPAGQYLIEFQPLTATGNDSFMMGEAEVGFGNRNVTITRR